MKIDRPNFEESELNESIKKLFGFSGSIKKLDSYIDQNYLIKDKEGKKFVLKIANLNERMETLDAQNKIMTYLSVRICDYQFPNVCKTIDGTEITAIQDEKGNVFFIRLLTFIDGIFLIDQNERSPDLLHNIGVFLARMDNELQSFYHPAAHRDFIWDLKNTLYATEKLQYIADLHQRRLIEYFLLQYETYVLPKFSHFRKSIIHNDANDYNLMVENINRPQNILGIIDFGDIVYTATICELAIAMTYLMLDQEKPIDIAKEVIRGYHEVFPLTEEELDALYYLICGRLCMSVTMSAHQKHLEPENGYITVSEKPAWELLDKLLQINPLYMIREFKKSCQFSVPENFIANRKTLFSKRQKIIGRNLSISYKSPLKIVKGALQYLYDEDGRTYLDAVNNVPHVGHCHPRVVRAAQQQMAILNTNTRYLHDSLVEYAERLTATMPDPLRVCYFVNSGSEANELALRLARNYTKSRETIVLDGAYHGNTNAVIELSPYKFDGPGGAGAAPHIQKVLMPDIYRGPYKADDPDAGKKYAHHVLDAIHNIESNGKKLSAFICEPLLGCGGQIVLPANYLKEAFRHIREAGGVCIADEVQIGFGRVGTHFWGFETQHVVPDIVTLGKPIGNGHPLAAVITTPGIADAFNNGMEYFNTFGGNPVSCAVGLAVFDVVEEEKLQDNALHIGSFMLKEFEQLKEKYSLIGDVRGLGLYLGIELVKNSDTLEPAPEQASAIVNRMKEKGILISTDGPLHNVLKIKPPMIFNQANAEFFIETLDRILKEF